ncbi:thioredoxin-dependent thiol peroxidase [Paraconexibacter algicola]|uniref:thioredoxin-dependent peroxiredoxin n=1 Tax=Paraconexibacter algicola TaxID=2133960 RepID=A0A2T4UHF9_9ACTN|nr:thioredoxin-dependent thiol peroxidase [Paraconexibacter algicola]PTL58670.1 thioredoxin-dependent thiol peroxidase [Paraconexibacter algicola]
MLEAGTPAPAFTLPDQDGDAVALADHAGKTVVLYFYPKADTPGCTTQACGVRDASAAYADRDVVVIGVSPDPVAKVKKFHDKQSLNFTLLADEDHAVCEQFGVWVEKSMYGKTFWGSSRTTFIIDETGVIRKVIPKVKPAEHDEQVLAALRDMDQAGA